MTSDDVSIISYMQDESYFTLHDLKGSRLSGSVFNILFNLNKFMAFETRDPFLIRQVMRCDFVSFNGYLLLLQFQVMFPGVARLITFYIATTEQERENPSLTEWDRFAHREYIRLSMEEDAEDASNGSADVWDESLEAPF